MSDIEFGNNLTERTSVKGKKERTQYRALGDSERENYRLRETIYTTVNYINYIYYCKLYQLYILLLDNLILFHMLMGDGQPLYPPCAK